MYLQQFGIQSLACGVDRSLFGVEGSSVNSGEGLVPVLRGHCVCGGGHIRGFSARRVDNLKSGNLLSSLYPGCIPLSNRMFFPPIVTKMQLFPTSYMQGTGR